MVDLLSTTNKFRQKFWFSMVLRIFEAKIRVCCLFIFFWENPGLGTRSRLNSRRELEMIFSDALTNVKIGKPI